MTTEESMQDEHLALAFECNRQLRKELERETIRLAACGVVAMSDTPESAAKVRDMHPDYRSASCDDVARRVDECIKLRAENSRLRYHLTELGKFADRAGLVLATIDPEDATEGEQLQEIINGISTWAAPAILGDVMQPIPCPTAEQSKP